MIRGAGKRRHRERAGSAHRVNAGAKFDRAVPPMHRDENPGDRGKRARMYAI
jgi:hypothetical protein